MAAPDKKPVTYGAEGTCHKCQKVATLYQSRTNGGSHVCRECYTQFVSTKASKRMESYKPRGSQPKIARKIMLPVSFGPSSISLLNILDAQIEGQHARMGRSSYELVVVNVQFELNDADSSSVMLDAIKSRYPRHSYITAKISDALTIESIDWSIFGVVQDETLIGDPDTRLRQLLSSLPSATARDDVLTTLLQQLLISLAKSHDCISILFGHSTTRLATKVLTSTASGRGFSLPWQVLDGPSPYGVDFGYPMRDLFTSEIVTYSKLVMPSLSDCIIEDGVKEISASSKNTTIDELMAQYFASIETNFPSIVANVVKTSSKLKAPDGEITDERCSLCDLPVEKGTDGIFGWGGDQSSTARADNSVVRENGMRSDAKSKILCYGCSRSVHG